MRSLVLGAATAAPLAIFGFASGGYYPTAWGWGALVALWLVATYVVVATPARPGIFALVTLGGLGLFAAWTWLSTAWSDDVDQSILEGQRALLYVAVAAALVLVARRAAAEPILGGILVGIVVPAAYGLATRLFPDRLGVFDPIAGYRLEEPVGYWNALGIFAAMGAALALGFAARGQMLTRGLAAAALPILLTTTYFTFSRGAWIALAVGLASAVALDPRRLQIVAVALVVGPVSAFAVWLASRQDALTRTDAPLSAATEEGHRLALYVVLLAAASALVAAAFALAESRVSVPRTARVGFAAALALIVLAALVAVFARYGDPVTIAEDTWDSFATTQERRDVDLRSRLFTFQGSYRVELWEGALDAYEDDPVLGAGAGTYEAYWTQHRSFAHKVRDAHTLYLETLAELGPLGLALLVAALGAPLVAALFARRHPLVPAATAAFVAFLVHAAVDWDWEVPAVTLAAIGCGVVVAAAAVRREVPPLGAAARWSVAAASTLLAAVALVGLVGASALSASEDALDRGRYDEAQDEARKAARWWRWSPEPWTQLGEAQLATGDAEAAAESFRKAVSKDRRDWALWYDLSTVTEGAESRTAEARARRLNRFYTRDLAEGSTRASR